MNAHEELLTKFYDAFKRRDHSTMGSFYAPDAQFSDPVFPALRGSAIMDMWTMLSTSGTSESSITFSVLRADERSGAVHWEARYIFGQTGRRVHNVMESRFTFEGDKIVRHHDTFDFWRWSRQALGPAGLLLGWTPILKNKVRKLAAGRLAAFQAQKAKAAAKV